MVNVLPVPALACSRVMPVGQIPADLEVAAGRSRVVAVVAVTGRPPVRAPAARPRAAARRRRSGSACRRRPGAFLRVGHAGLRRACRRRAAARSEDEHVLGLLVLVVAVVRRRPCPGGGRGRVPPRGHRLGPGGRRLEVERHGCAHRPLEEVHQRAAGGARPWRADWPRPSRAGRRGRPRWSDRLVRPLPMVHASKGRSGRLAVRASRRSHASRRAAGPSFEYVTEWTTSPRTPATVPTRPARPGRSSWTSSETGSAVLCPARHQLVERAGDVVEDGVGQLPRRQRAARQLRRPGTSAWLAPASWACSTRSATCHRSSPSSSIGMASSKSRVLLRKEIPSRSRRKARDRVAQEPLELVEADGARRRRARGNARGTTARSCRGVSAARAPARCSASKLHGAPATSSPDTKLRRSKGWRGCATTTASRARPVADRTVWSMTSSSSPTGTAGGRGRLERSSRPE